MSNRIIIRERVSIPKKLIDEDRLLSHYEKRIYDEGGCSKCPILNDRHALECSTCPNYKGIIKLWREGERKDGTETVEVPAGDLKAVEARLNISLENALDKRPIIKFRNPIKWTGKLRRGETINGVKTPDQADIIKKWLKSGASGIIEAPPRTGKSVIGVRLSCFLGVRTLIVAHQDDLLKNFLKCFKRDTNLRQLQKKTGKEIVGIVKKPQDLTKYDVAMVTYQSFIRDSGPIRIKKYINKHFSFLIVDETHQVPAFAYMKFANSLLMKYRLGLTATPKRKDGLSYCLYPIMGRVTVKALSTSLLPKISLWETNIKPPHRGGYKVWPYAINFLCNNVKRNEMIVKQVFADLRAGHKAIIIPTDRRKHIELLCKMINKQAAINRIKRKEKWPVKMAVPFYRGVDRDKILSGVEKGEFKVIVAIMKMMKQGIDMSAPSMLYVTIPTSNPAMFYQLANRPCTPAPDKLQPVVRLMIDKLIQSSGCFRSIFTKEIHPKLKQRGNDPPRYLIDEKDRRRAWDIIKNKEYHLDGEREDDDTYAPGCKTSW